MSRFATSGLAPDGTTRHVYVEAETIAAATKILEEQGYREVLVHSSPEELELDKLASTCVREQLEQLKPDQNVQVRQGAGLAVILKRNWFSLTLSLVLTTGGLWSGSAWLIISGIALLLACLFIIIPVMLYAELTRARIWCDWQRVPKLVRALRFFTLPIQGVNVRLDLDVARASALSGLGKLEEALALIESWRNHPRVTARIFHSRKVMIFLAARRFDDALESARRAFLAAPDSVESRLDVALLLLQFADQREEAHSLIEPLADIPLPELQRATFRLCQGMLSVERGEYVRSLEPLEEAKLLLTPSKWATEAFSRWRTDISLWRMPATAMRPSRARTRWPHRHCSTLTGIPCAAAWPACE